MCKIKRSGWDRENVAKDQNDPEHSVRAAQIGYVIALMEGYNEPEKIAVMLMFHDMPEIRTGDPNLMTRKYITIDEEKALADQLAGLGFVGETINKIVRIFIQKDKQNHAYCIARDADILEMILTAREHKSQGMDMDASWFNGSKLQTESGIKLHEAIMNTDPKAWWKNFLK